MSINRKALGIVVLILSFISYLVSNIGVIKDAVRTDPIHVEQQLKGDAAEVFKLTEQRRTHILYGDGTGGGHKAGQGVPGKTEYPASWDDTKIVSVVTRLANDNTLPMRQSGARYWVRTGEEEGLQIRIVLDREKGEIVTAYPINRERN